MRGTNRYRNDRDTLIIAIKFFSGLRFTDEQLKTLLRDYFNIEISVRQIKKIKAEFNKNI